MDQFRAALGRFLTGELDFSGLEQSLVDSLASDATVGPQILALLDELYNGGRLPHQLYAALKKRLLGHVTRPSERSRPRTPHRRRLLLARDPTTARASGRHRRIVLTRVRKRPVFACRRHHRSVIAQECGIKPMRPAR